MKIESTEAKRYDWDQCKSWNYKLTHLDPKRSVVYAEVTGDHGDASSQDLERIYYIVDGNAEFTVGSEVALVSRGDVLTIPPHTDCRYHALPGSTLKLVLFMELWDN